MSGEANRRTLQRDWARADQLWEGSSSVQQTIPLLDTVDRFGKCAFDGVIRDFHGYEI